MQKGIFALVCAIIITFLSQSCSKEQRKVDINDGKENGTNRKLIIEVTDRYFQQQTQLDSVLPNVGVTLYESDEDLLTNRYYRSDTTGFDGKVTFQQIKADTFIVVLTHRTLGTRQATVHNTVNTVVSYEYFYF